LFCSTRFSTDDEFGDLSKEKETNFSPHLLDLEGVGKDQAFFVGFPPPPRLQNAKHLSPCCGGLGQGVSWRGVGGVRIWLFFCLYLPGVTSLANLDHFILDYCLRSCSSLLPVLQTDQMLCDDDNELPNISRQLIAGCLHCSTVFSCPEWDQVVFAYV